MTKHSGSCHCGAIRYVVDLDLASGAVTYWDGRHDNWQAVPRATPFPIGAERAA